MLSTFAFYDFNRFFIKKISVNERSDLEIETCSALHSCLFNWNLSAIDFLVNLSTLDQGRKQIDNWGGGNYSHIRVLPGYFLFGNQSWIRIYDNPPPIIDLRTALVDWVMLVFIYVHIRSRRSLCRPHISMRSKNPDLFEKIHTIYFECKEPHADYNSMIN